MKQIKSFGIARTRVEESFGYLNVVKSEISNLPLEGGEDRPGALREVAANPLLTAAVDEFTVALDAFDGALKNSASLASVAKASEDDQHRDASWRGANNYLKAMMAHPTAEVAAVAADFQAVFAKYGDPTKLSMTEESGVLHNLLQDFEKIRTDASAQVETVAFGVWLDDLKAKEDAFLASVAVRTEEEAARQVGVVKEKRTASELAYRKLVGAVNALAMVEGEAAYAVFIDHVNTQIERQQAVLKSRSTRSKKKEEGDDRPGGL